MLKFVWILAILVGGILGTWQIIENDALLETLVAVTIGWVFLLVVGSIIAASEESYRAHRIALRDEGLKGEEFDKAYAKVKQKANRDFGWFMLLTGLAIGAAYLYLYGVLDTGLFGITIERK
jgi:hypothetical protein